MAGFGICIIFSALRTALPILRISSKQLSETLEFNENTNFGFAAWNTTSNTLGTVIAMMIIKLLAEKYDSYNAEAFKKLMAVRLLDDWAYQANVRSQITKPCNITIQMKKYEQTVLKILNLKTKHSIITTGINGYLINLVISQKNIN